MMVSQNRRVLVVDDEQSVRRLAQRALTDAGLECDMAADGVHACRMAKSTRYAAVITDLRMPNRHGHSLAIELLSTEPAPLLFVVTGVLEPKIAADLSSRGVTNVFHKPCDFKKLAAEVKSSLEQSRPRSEPADVPAESSESRSGAPLASDGSPGHSRRPAALQPAAAGQTKRVFAILLRDPQKCGDLAQRLANDSIEALPATNMEHLYELFSRKRVNIFVIEDALENLFTGVEIVERLNRDFLPPRTILLAHPSTQDSERMKELAIDLVLDPNCGADKIVDSTQELLVKRAADQPIIPLMARRLIEGTERISELPKFVAKLAAYMDLELQNVPVKQVCKDIASDEDAVRELLKLANGCRGDSEAAIDDVSEAVRLLGARRSVALMIAAAAVEAQTSLLEAWDKPMRDWYRQRSALIAGTAAAFAQKCEEVCPDTAFLLGLLQEIGVLAMGACIGKRYVNHTVPRARTTAPLQLHVVEQNEFKTTHAEVSAAVLARWGLPMSFIKPILNHHKTGRAIGDSRNEEAVLRVMRIGEALANLADTDHAYRMHALNQLLSEYVPDKAVGCRDSLSESTARVITCCQLLSLPVPDESMMKKLVQKIISSNQSLKTCEEDQASAEKPDEGAIETSAETIS